MSLKRNVVYLTVEKAVHTLGGLLSMFLVARVLGTSALADYGFAISLTAFFIPVLDLGLNNRTIKSVASGSDAAETVAPVFSYKVSISLFVLAAMVGIGWMWGGPRVSPVVVLIGLSTISMSTGDCANAAFKGLQTSQLSCALVSGLNVLLVGSMVTVLYLGAGLVAVAACYAVSRTAYALVALWLVHRVGPGCLRFQLGLDREMLWSGFLHLPGIYYLGNLLHLSYLATYVLSPGEAGMFYVGYRAAAGAYVLISAGFEAVLASTFSEGRRPPGLGMWFVIYSVIALLLLFFVAPFATWIFGEVYVLSVRPIRLLASCVPPFALCGLAHTLLLAARRERYATVVMSGLVVVGFGLSLLAEHSHGPETTALVPTVSSTLAMLLLWVSLARFVKEAPGGRT